MLPLPKITMPSPGSAFIARTAPAMSLVTSFVFFQDASAIVREKTTFGRLFIRSATTGIVCVASGVGQKLTMRS
jgi:hypothetical protein